MKALKHINLLGNSVVDKVTGFSGVVTSVGFDLYGCIQAIVTPEVRDDSTLPDCRWFDVNRLTVSGRKMPTPDFDHQDIALGDQGCADKPVR